MIKILNKNKTIRYIANNYKISLERAEELIDNGVENIKFLDIKYVGFGDFQITC